MSIQPFPHRNPPTATPIEPYFSALPLPAIQLRPLTALEQMYAYWGSDRD